MKFFDKILLKIKVACWSEEFGEINYILKTNGDIEKALEILTKIEKIESDSEIKMVVFLYKAMTLYFLKRYEESIINCDLALEGFPDFGELFFIKGESLMHLGKYEDAIESYNKTLKDESNDITILNKKGFCLNKLNKYQEAINVYNEILEIEPWNIGIIDNKSLSLEYLKKTENGINKKDNNIIRIIKTKFKDTDMWVIGEQKNNDKWNIYLIDPQTNYKELIKENFSTEMFARFSEETLKTLFPHEDL